MKTVRILGMAPNLQEMEPPEDPTTEIWPSNDQRGYRKRSTWVVQQDRWTRWFNLHSRQHMEAAYPASFNWHLLQDGSRPFYTQRFWPDIPGCIEFPGPQIQEYFATAAGPNKFFTCSVCWLIAFAIMEGFERIELWGFKLSDTKPGERYVFERPCFFYWVQQARDRGVDVWYQKEVAELPFLPGDPDTYTGPLYGYETKPEPRIIT